MQVVTPNLIKGKKVLLRLDIDVPIENGKILEDFRLHAGLDTLELCVEHADSVTVMGHIGRPGGKEDPKLSVKPVVEWFEEIYSHVELPEGKFHILENLRFEPGEEEGDINFAKELASFGDFYVNDAFASHHPSASTTVIASLLPHAAGLRFKAEVDKLLQVRNNPPKPLIAIIGGAKLEDKLKVLNKFAEIADKVLVGGKLPKEIKEKGMTFPENVLIGNMTEDGFDLSDESINQFKETISSAKQVIWAGPVGFYEEGHNKGNQTLAQAIINADADSIIGGGDTITALTGLQFIDQFSFVSTGGGAMLKLLSEGTLPTIEALN